MIDLAGRHVRLFINDRVNGGDRDVRGRRTRLAGVVALLVLAALLAVAWALQRPPAPVAASAPATTFSAERAYADLQRMAGPEPTPIGSVAGDAVRDYLVSTLSAAGLSVEVQKGLGSRTFGGVTAAGLVDNVVATLPGYASTGRVVLAAHYDTTFGTPGAADDKSSVAAMLETARALGGKPLRNDLVMIFTDGEEAGLLGASFFVAERPRNDQGGVVLNWEATGNMGPSVLFETSSGNAELIKEYAAAAPYPVGDSALAALYQAGNQNSDFTPLHEAGFVGLNFALMDGTAAYHHSGDTAERLDRAGLQHMGANMLALTRGLGTRDLAGLRSSDDAVFFSAFGELITYPVWLVWPLAGLSVAILTALAVLARRRGPGDHTPATRRRCGGAAADRGGAIGGDRTLAAAARDPPWVRDAVHGRPLPPALLPVGIGSTYRHYLADLVPRAASPDWTCKPGDRSVGVAHGPRCGYCIAATCDVVLRVARHRGGLRRRTDRTPAPRATTDMECGCPCRRSATRCSVVCPGRSSNGRRPRHRQWRGGGGLLRSRWSDRASACRARTPD